MASKVAIILRVYLVSRIFMASLVSMALRVYLD